MSTSRKTRQRLEAAVTDQAVQNRHINDLQILVCLYFQARLLSACVTDKNDILMQEDDNSPKDDLPLDNLHRGRDGPTAFWTEEHLPSVS